MSTTGDYGYPFREAYALLHGGRPDEAGANAERRPGESLEEYLARSRSEALSRTRRRLSAATPPPGLEQAHELLERSLEGAFEADQALAAQVEAHGCGQFQESVAHSDELQALVSEGARLDRELILALREAESRAPGTLAELGIAGIVPPLKKD